VAVIGLGAIAIASGYSFFMAYREYPDRRTGGPNVDKKRHCYASCVLNKATLGTVVPAWSVGYAFEFSQKAGLGNYYSEADLEANAYGISIGFSEDCKRACDQCPIQ
jgi:hypothetical protein